MNGTTLDYVRGGKGPALILIHRFSARLVRISAHHAPARETLHRRRGGSAWDRRLKATPAGYDAANMAEDVD